MFKNTILQYTNLIFCFWNISGSLLPLNISMFFDKNAWGILKAIFVNLGFGLHVLGIDKLLDFDILMLGRSIRFQK